MNDQPSNDPATHPDDMNAPDHPLSLTETLINRVIDRTAAPTDFDDLLAQSERSPAPLRQLVLALRDDCALLAGVESALDVADAVAAPVGRPHLSLGTGGAARWRGWSGWAAAMLLAMCWIGSAGWMGRAPAAPGASNELNAASPSIAMTTPAPSLPEAEGLTPLPANRDEAPRPRVTEAGAQGHVVGELPLQLVSTRRAADGPGYDVLVLRRVLERSRVDNVLSLGADDSGRPAPISIDPVVLAKTDSY